MTKSEFIAAYEVVQQYHLHSKELGEMLHKTLLDGHSVVCFGSKLQEAYIKLLHDVSGVPAELIEQLLYEGAYSYNHLLERTTLLWRYSEWLRKPTRAVVGGDALITELKKGK